MTKRETADLTEAPLRSPGWNSVSTPSRLLESAPPRRPGAVNAFLLATDRITDSDTVCGDVVSVYGIIEP
jgi:hypothetical protein